MNDFTNKQIKQAKQAKSAEELLALAKENGVEMTKEEAMQYFAKLTPTSGELSDEELDHVAGGGCGKANRVLAAADCPVGSHVRVRSRTYCWDTDRKSIYLVDEGVLPGGCNSTELVVTAFNPQTEMVAMICPKCYRNFSAPFVFVEKYL